MARRNRSLTLGPLAQLLVNLQFDLDGFLGLEAVPLDRCVASAIVLWRSGIDDRWHVEQLDGMVQLVTDHHHQVMALATAIHPDMKDAVRSGLRDRQKKTGAYGASAGSVVHIDDAVGTVVAAISCLNVGDRSRVCSMAAAIAGSLPLSLGGPLTRTRGRLLRESSDPLQSAP